MAWAVAGPFCGLLKVVVVIPLLIGSVRAQQTSARPDVELPLKVVRQIDALLAAKAQRTAAQRKVSSQFLDARRKARGQPSMSSIAALQAPAKVAADELVTVDIRADVAPAVLVRIQSLGGTVVNSVPKYRAIRARLPLAALEPLATLEAIQFIRSADQPITQQVLVRSAAARAGAPNIATTRTVDTSEGDVAHQANVARQTHSVDGTGIGIGVISDGVVTLADQQATGDVPARVTVLPGQEGDIISYACGGSSSGTEGTAMLEIVHDLAPGAELLFATGNGGSAQMAQNIADLCAAGADIIVDDIGYLLAQAFQDDVISQAVSAAAANGCYYFSSAGNGGNLTDGTAGVWEGDFANGGTLTVNGVLVGFAHDFGGGVTGNQVKRNSTLPIVLQWADPVDGSANDYDLFLIDADNNVLASSTNTQDGTQDPIEFIRGSCNDDREGTRLVIVKNTGAADRYLRLNYARGGLEIATAGHTFGPIPLRRMRWAWLRSRRRFRRDGVGRDVQLGRAEEDLLPAKRHSDHGGRFFLDRREAAAEAGPCRRDLCVDLDARLFNVQRHLGSGAARGGDCGVDAGGGWRPRQRDAGGASHGDDRSVARYRGNRRRSRLRRRHRDGAGRGGRGGCGQGGPQQGADGG